MSESNRISGSEQAAQDAIASAQKKVREKNTQKATTQHATGQTRTPDGSKALKSAFDQVLESYTPGASNASTPAQNKFDSALHEARGDEERGGSEGRTDDSDDKDTKPKEGREKSSQGKENPTGIRGRVTAKQSFQGQGEKNSQGREQDSRGGREFSKRPFFEGQLKTGNRAENVMAPPPPSAIFRTPEVKAPEVPGTPRELPKAVLDQIVQSVTISRNKDLGKEIQIEFHDNFFNGLRLKVSAQGQEISVTFLTTNRDVEATFKQEREKIAMALGEKDIAVRSIEVVLS